MKTFPIPLNSKPYQNVEQMTLTEDSIQLLDGYIDEKGHTVSRPGLSPFAQVGSSHYSSGAYWWERMGVSIFVSDGRIYSVEEDGSVTDLSDTDLVNINNPVTFADNGDYLVIATGGRMVYTDGTAASVQYIADGDAPIDVTHVIFLDNWIIANEVGTGRFHYADFVGAPTAWFAVDVFSAESNPDNIIALYVLPTLFYVVGTASIEFWINDGVSPFSRLGGTSLSKGGMSPYSGQIVNQTFYFFDNTKRLSYLSGTQIVPVNTPFDKTIQQIDQVQDSFMFYITPFGRNFIVILFPSANRSFVYDFQSDSWYEWSYWQESNSTRKRFLGNCYCFASAWNKHLFGSFQSDDILEMKEEYVDDDGADIRMSKISGFLDHGSPNQRKRCYSLSLRIKTGEGIGDEGSEIPYFRMKYEDVLKDGTTKMSNWRQIPMNVRGERGFLVTLRNLGSYYIRRYFFESSQKVKFVMGDAYTQLDAYEF